MIKCKACGYAGEYKGPVCPECGRWLTLTREEAAERYSEVERALSEKDYTTALAGYRMLADLGYTTAEREYAMILERGELTDRDLDAAMTYFGRAAEKNDAISAYRYSRLAERVGSEASRFWLAFSVVLGCKEAYPVLADRLSREGDEEGASYYYYLAAACDDTESIVTMAKRYYSGTGLPQSEAYAKWYLDKLSLPPIHAVKLAWSLRKTPAEEPPTPTVADYDELLRRLAKRAEDFRIPTAYFTLRALLADRGDLFSRMTLGVLCLEGVGTRQNTELGMSHLSYAAAHGSAEAYRHIGDVYLAGRLVPRDVDRAIESYRAAAVLGLSNAYEIMGDVFCEGKLLPRDVREAIRLYDLAATEGDVGAGVKSEALKRKREELYLSAMEEGDPRAAFRSLAVSTGMGYLPAYRALAHAYLEGYGTAVDRPRGFMWLHSAVEAGYNEALTNLALCYSRGIGVNRDFRLAVKYLSAAVNRGSVEAKEELKRLLEGKKRRLLNATYARAMELLFMKKPAAAREYLSVCAALGHAKGIYTLGCLSEFGVGAPTDRGAAKALYERAYTLSFRDPRSVYKLKVLKMCRS